jgi:hypothetical protein
MMSAHRIEYCRYLLTTSNKESRNKNHCGELTMVQLARLTIIN